MLISPINDLVFLVDERMNFSSLKSDDLLPCFYFIFTIKLNISYTNLHSVGMLDIICVDLHEFNSGMVVPVAIPLNVDR